MLHNRGNKVNRGVFLVITAAFQTILSFPVDNKAMDKDGSDMGLQGSDGAALCYGGGNMWIGSMLLM